MDRASSAPEQRFTGFPEAALDFYDDLELENTRAFWGEHKHVYADAVRAPMVALCAALADEFGEARVFRPHRDVRFRKDKTPYKTHQGAFAGLAPATGWYVEVSARGVRTGGGFYSATADRLAEVRRAIDDERSGTELERMVEGLVGSGWTVGGDQLRTKPRGYAADHPRVALLRHRSLVLRRDHGFEPVIHSPDLVEQVRRDWRELRPLVEWVAERTDTIEVP